MHVQDIKQLRIEALSAIKEANHLRLETEAPEEETHRKLDKIRELV